MTDTDKKIAIGASLVLTLSVAVNLMALQDERRPRVAMREAPYQHESGGDNAFITKTALAIDAQSNANASSSAGAPSAAAPPVAPPAQDDAPAMNTAEIVSGVQRELNNRGYDAGRPDGVAGLITRSAIMAYEHDYGLPITARPNELLLSRIVLGSSQPPGGAVAQDAKLTPEAESIVKQVKQLLTNSGFQAGKIDGVITPQLRRAIREFEIAQKLPESARISGPLVSRLVRLQPAQTAKDAGRRSASR